MQKSTVRTKRGDRSNGPRVMAAAKEIVRRLRHERGTTVGSLMREYGTSYATIRRAILSRITARQYGLIVRRIRRRAKHPTAFTKGLVPWNKDKKGIHLSPKTEFKKGCLRGQAARNWRPIGAITIRHDTLLNTQRKRTHKDGTKRKGKPRRWIKVRDDGPLQSRFIPYARYLWEKAYGVLPDGLIVVHEDGDQMNDSTANLIAVDRRRHIERTCHSDPEVVARRHKAACKSRKRNTKARRALRKATAAAARARPLRRYYCNACGADYPARPDRCPKCGSSAFEPIYAPEGAAR